MALEKPGENTRSMFAQLESPVWQNNGTAYSWSMSKHVEACVLLRWPLAKHRETWTTEVCTTAGLVHLLSLLGDHALSWRFPVVRWFSWEANRFTELVYPIPERYRSRAASCCCCRQCWVILKVAWHVNPFWVHQFHIQVTQFSGGIDSHVISIGNHNLKTSEAFLH